MEIATTLNPSNLTTYLATDKGLNHKLYDNIVFGIIVFGLCAALFAIVGNILTIIVYFRLGFSDSTNISLVTLAISDMFVSFSSGCFELFHVLPFLNDFLIPEEISFTTMSCPNLVFTLFSALITSFLSLERYLCILLPLKIKRIITPRRTFVVMIFIFMVSVPPVVIVYFRYPLGMRYVHERNKTVLAIMPSDDKSTGILYLVWQVYSANILPIMNYFIVLTCTILLALSLRKNKKWRETHGHVWSTHTAPVPEHRQTKENKNTSSKEARAVRMVVAIATVFLVSTIPACVHIIASMTVPGFEINGQNSDLFIITDHALLAIASLNAGANILIYYNMSTKFRTAVKDLICSSKMDSKLYEE